MLTRRQLRIILDELDIGRLDITQFSRCVGCDRVRWGGIMTMWHLQSPILEPMIEADICHDCIKQYGVFINNAYEIRKNHREYVPCFCFTNNRNMNEAYSPPSYMNGYNLSNPFEINLTEPPRSTQQTIAVPSDVPSFGTILENMQEQVNARLLQEDRQSFEELAMANDDEANI